MIRKIAAIATVGAIAPGTAALAKRVSKLETQVKNLSTQVQDLESYRNNCLNQTIGIGSVVFNYQTSDGTNGSTQIYTKDNPQFYVPVMMDPNCT